MKDSQMVKVITKIEDVSVYLPIKYTPDFIGDDFIIETKGRANESFPMRWKLFKRLSNEQFPTVTLYKPQNQKECDENDRANPFEKQKNS